MSAVLRLLTVYSLAAIPIDILIGAGAGHTRHHLYTAAACWLALQARHYTVPT